MTRKNKKLTAAIGLGLGITIFAGAALAGYGTSSGYDVGKKSVKGLLSNENYTFDASMTLTVDGGQVSQMTVNELYDRNGDVKLNRVEDGTNLYGSPNMCKTYWQGDNYIVIYTSPYGEEHTMVNIGDDIRSGSLDIMNEVTDEKERDTYNKIIRFAELAADTFVGDLKNNVVFTGEENGSSTYEMNLDAVQIPELANAGLSAIFSSINQNSFDGDDDPFLILGTDPIVKNASLKFTVDAEGRLTYACASGTMAGDGHEAELKISLNIYDYGTTRPERIDVSTLKNVEYLADHRSVTVKEDGTAVDYNGNVVGTIEISEDGSEIHYYKD